LKLTNAFSLPSFGKPALPAQSKDLQVCMEPLLSLWVAFAGLLLFAGYLLYEKGVWASLLSADPTYLTALIVVLFTGTTVWVGVRAKTLTQELDVFLQFEALLNQSPTAAKDWLHLKQSSWAYELFTSIKSKGHAWRDHARLIDLLAEKTSAPHEMPWWINGVLLKLGLLGKVIGFSIMALQLGEMSSFDSGQTSAVLKTLTGGLGIALLTTMTGLAANILLGIQLMRLDRFADDLTAKAIKISEVDLQKIMDC
jgi:hypothetical protein